MCIPFLTWFKHLAALKIKDTTFLLPTLYFTQHYVLRKEALRNALRGSTGVCLWTTDPDHSNQKNTGFDQPRIRIPNRIRNTALVCMNPKGIFAIHWSLLKSLQDLVYPNNLVFLLYLNRYFPYYTSSIQDLALNKNQLYYAIATTWKIFKHYRNWTSSNWDFARNMNLIIFHIARIYTGYVFRVLSYTCIIAIVITQIFS